MIPVPVFLNAEFCCLQHPAYPAKRADVLTFTCGMNLRARFDDFLQCGLLELFVLFAHPDQFGQLVVALFEQRVDVGPGLGYGVLDGDQINAKPALFAWLQDKPAIQASSGFRKTCQRGQQIQPGCFF